ncbi:hypothetical protein F6W96_39755 [Nocardia terpenica]|uniref:Uncharacterized protein n=2 Tax=Nocardia terpenica TaxID=455432 RepID=A0A6G9ZGI9_9NOCA|nr:hypothetical protein F6W96_39755 [Nocardia terpenica]
MSAREVFQGAGVSGQKVALYTSTTENGTYTQVAGKTTVDNDGKWSLTPTSDVTSDAVGQDLYFKIRQFKTINNQDNQDTQTAETTIRCKAFPLVITTPTTNSKIATHEPVTGTWGPDFGSVKLQYSTDGTTWTDTGTTTVDANGKWAYTPSGTGWPTGQIHLKACPTTTTSADERTITVTVTPLTITSPTAGEIISPCQPFTGTGPAGRTLQLKRWVSADGSGATIVASTTIGADGSWVLTPTTPLPSGRARFTIGSQEMGWSYARVEAIIVELVVWQPRNQAQVCPTEVFSGMAVPGHSIALEGSTRLDTTTVDQRRQWRLQPQEPLTPSPDGQQLTVRDLNDDRRVELTVTVVDLKVAYPAEHASISPWQLFTGSGPAGHTVAIDRVTRVDPDDTRSGYRVVGRHGHAVIDDNGRWQLSATSHLPDGPVALRFVLIKHSEEHYMAPPRWYRVRRAAARSDGRPGQVMPLASGMLPGPGQTLLAVTGGAETGRRWWAAVDSFAETGPTDQVVRVDPAVGVVVFGPEVPGRDGPRRLGAIPEKDTHIAAVIAETAGAAGNLPAGSLTQVRGPGETGVRVHQARPARGGRDGETPAGAVARFAQGFPLGRAVTAEDYRRLLMRAGIGLGRVVCAEPPEQARAEVDLQITLVPDLCGQPPTAERLTPPRSTMDAACTWLDIIRPLGTVLTVSGPAVREMTVTAHVELWSEPRDAAGLQAVETAVRQAIVAYWHPLTGGPVGEGWPLGVLPQRGELYPLVEAVPAVRAVHELTLDAKGGAVTGRVLPVLSTLHLLPRSFLFPFLAGDVS